MEKALAVLRAKRVSPLPDFLRSEGKPKVTAWVSFTLITFGVKVAVKQRALGGPCGYGQAKESNLPSGNPNKHDFLEKYSISKYL